MAWIGRSADWKRATLSAVAWGASIILIRII
jgi:hypothetical protein